MNVTAQDEKIQVFVVDDDSTFRMTIVRELTHMGFEVEAVDGGMEAVKRLKERVFDVVLLDIRMPDLDGIAVLEALQVEQIQVEVVMLTGHGTVENAVDAMKLGAYDYLVKPCSLDELEVTVRKASEKKRLIQRNAALTQEMARHRAGEDMIGSSRAIHSVLDMMARVAPSDSTVLICGESGVGKELVAKGIHKASLRSREPFVVIDCTSLQESLLESELFGHERGAYTGATSLKHGLLEVADSGTILLDEVSETTPNIQAKLLRALETGTFRRVGGIQSIRVNVRVLAATNRDLELLVEEGHFRKDLYYRLNVVTIVVPSLRSRVEDIRDLSAHFAAQCRTADRHPKELAGDTIESLMRYSWPGNVRELKNVIERAALLCDSGRIGPDDLPENLRKASTPSIGDNDEKLSLNEAEARHIKQILAEVDGHRGRAAKILGISERQLYRKLRSHGLQAPSESDDAGPSLSAAADTA